NRLKLPGIVDFIHLGQTTGWGHFHIPQPLFLLMRELLQQEGHPYASGHEFGTGPNWRLRVAKESVRRVGLDPHLLQHGISREVYGVPLISNWREYLCGMGEIESTEHPPVATVGKQAVNRWLIPRAKRRQEYLNWTREDTWKLLTGETS
ncbi:MAG: Druantia anti-phage system protein DruA, partial [Ktedonobacteraceae bacterium]